VKVRDGDNRCSLFETDEVFGAFWERGGALSLPERSGGVAAGLVLGLDFGLEAGVDKGEGRGFAFADAAHFVLPRALRAFSWDHLPSVVSNPVRKANISGLARIFNRCFLVCPGSIGIVLQCCISLTLVSPTRRCECVSLLFGKLFRSMIKRGTVWPCQEDEEIQSRRRHWKFWADCT